MNKEQPPYLLVTDNAQLSRIAVGLRGETAIGVDLEADSMYHYREQVCLIQISTPFQNILLDPISLDDLSPLFPVFADPHIRKVFHGADYDIRLLYKHFRIEVNALFDTQIAARFLGSAETGLAYLLKERLGVLLEKKYQKKDWSKRPLPADMLVYAVQDSCHLLSLSRILEEELNAKDRLFCVEEECEILSKTRPAPSNDDPLFLRFKGAGRLDRRGLAVLESILQLREDMARRKNIPPFKILGNAPIMEIAVRRPTDEQELEGIKGLGAAQIKILGRSILEKTETSLRLPEDALPVFPKHTGQRVSVRVSRRIKTLKAWRDGRARDMGVEPSLVCTNAQIQSLALQFPERSNDREGINTLKAWQKRLFEEEIGRLLESSV